MCENNTGSYNKFVRLYEKKWALELERFRNSDTDKKDIK
jgi:hypothetical protein